MTRLVSRDQLVREIQDEHLALLDAADDLIRITAVIQRAGSAIEVIEDLRALAHRLSGVDSLAEREERVIYARLELRGILQTPHVLRLDHEAISLEVKALRVLAATPPEPAAFRRELRRIRNALVPLIRDHVRREQRDLIPLALEAIGEECWSVMKYESDAIGHGALADKASA